MLDATVCDIYLVNEYGGIVGRPTLTACIDAFSSLCCGYALTWEGGMYSLRQLMLNVVTDKQELCKKHGININPQDGKTNISQRNLYKIKEFLKGNFLLNVETIINHLLLSKEIEENEN